MLPIMVSSTWSIVRGFNRSIQLWLVFWALGGFAYFGLQGVLLNLYLLRLGFGPQFIGLLVGFGQIAWGLAALPAAAVGRRVGLRTAQQAGCLGIGLGFGLLLLVERVPRPFWEGWLLGSWAVVWLGAALGTVNSVPYAMAIAYEDERSAVFPVQQAVIAVTTLVGSLAAGVLPGLVSAWTGAALVEPGPFRSVLWLIPLAFLAAVPVLGGAREARSGNAASTADRQVVAPPIGLFLLVGALVFLQNAAEAPVRAFFNVYLDRGLGVAPSEIGLIIGLAQLLPVATAIFAVRLLTRRGAARTMAIAGLGTSVSSLLLATIAVAGAAGLGFMGVMMMAAIYGPARSLFSQELVLPRWRTTTSAILTIGMALGSACTTAGGGFVISTVGFGGLFAVSAGLAAGSAALAWSTYRLRAERLAAPAALGG